MKDIDQLAEKLNNYAKAERLAFIDFKVRFEGRILRSDLTEEFGISEPIATKEIADYKSETQDMNIRLDKHSKTHVINTETYKPLIKIRARDALEMHFEGFCRNKLRQYQSSNFKRACEIPSQLCTDSVATITRAIANGTNILCTYISANSRNHNQRKLSPLSVYFDGLNWVFRARDAHDNIFKSFHFGRVKEAKETSEESLLTTTDDPEWNMLIPIHLQLHPNLNEYQKAAFRIDFGMEADQEEKVFIERAVFAWSLFERWSVDTSITPIRLPTEANRYNFHLKNAALLQHVDCIKYLIKDLQINLAG